MADNADPSFADPSTVIDSDIACRKCGYNLRGLNALTRCPECGVAVGLSLRGDLLRFANPAWVELLGRGISLILWGIVVSAIAGLVSAMLSRLVGGAIPALLATASSLVGLWGAWLVTTPDPSRVGEDVYGGYRRTVRVCLALGLVGSTFALFEHISLPPPLGALCFVAAFVAGLATVPGEFAKYSYFAKLAERIPDPALVKRARLLRWALSSTLGGTMVFGALAALAAILTMVAITPTGPSPAAKGAAFSTPAAGMGSVAALACIVPLLMLMMLVFWAMAILFQRRLGKALREQAEFAHDTWARSATPPV
ncbi:MAG: hypothetical protein U1D55_16555 [Phycisphaerae bacterium]